MVLVPGMGEVYIIEPMINAGSYEIVIDSDNGWTVYTKDGSLFLTMGTYHISNR